MPITIVTRAGKGNPLTWAELDANFNNLKTAVEALQQAPVVGVDGNTAANATDYAIGTYLMAQYDTLPNLNAGLSLWVSATNPHVGFTNQNMAGANAPKLAGTWRSRGLASGDSTILVQRVS